MTAFGTFTPVALFHGRIDFAGAADRTTGASYGERLLEDPVAANGDGSPGNTTTT